MSHLYNIIDDLCRTRGINIQILSKEIGLHRNTLPRLKTDPSKKIAMETAEKIANYFHVPIDYLLDHGEISPSDIPPEPEISDEQLMFALWGDKHQNMTKADLEQVRQFANYIEAQKNGG